MRPSTVIFGENYNLLTFSKHLLICFYINVGSLVYAKISSSDSSDKKKKRGKHFKIFQKNTDKIH